MNDLALRGTISTQTESGKCGYVQLAESYLGIIFVEITYATKGRDTLLQPPIDGKILLGTSVIVKKVEKYSNIFRALEIEVG